MDLVKKIWDAHRSSGNTKKDEDDVHRQNRGGASISSGPKRIPVLTSQKEDIEERHTHQNEYQSRHISDENSTGSDQSSADIKTKSIYPSTSVPAYHDCSERVLYSTKTSRPRSSLLASGVGISDSVMMERLEGRLGVGYRYDKRSKADKKKVKTSENNGSEDAGPSSSCEIVEVMSDEEEEQEDGEGSSKQSTAISIPVRVVKRDEKQEVEQSLVPDFLKETAQRRMRGSNRKKETAASEEGHNKRLESVGMSGPLLEDVTEVSGSKRKEPSSPSSDDVIVLQGERNRPRIGQASTRRKSQVDSEVAAPLLASCLSFLLEESEASTFKVASEYCRDATGTRNSTIITATATTTSSTRKAHKSKHFQFSPDQLKDLSLRLICDDLLSDEVLNRAVDMLAHMEASKDVLLFNTFWYEKVKDGRQQEVHQWLRRAMGDRTLNDIKLICTPVNISNAHWVLVFADLERGTIQEWDPAQVETLTRLGPSPVSDVKDAIETALPNFKLRLEPPPPDLPQQDDAVSCGLFVIIYIIHLCFRARQNSGAGGDGLLPPPAACSFYTQESDLFRYRLFLLAWILNSQTSLLPETEPVVLACIMDSIRVGGTSSSSPIGGASRVLMSHESPSLLFKRSTRQTSRLSKEVTNEIHQRRCLFASLLRDDGLVCVGDRPRGKGLEGNTREGLVHESMKLLNRFSRGEIFFLSPQWYEKVKEGKLEEALHLMSIPVIGHGSTRLQSLIIPVYFRPKEVGKEGDWLLVHVSVMGEGEITRRMIFYGTLKTLAHMDDVMAVLTDYLEGLLVPRTVRWESSIVVLDHLKTEEYHQTSIALIVLAMEACRFGFEGGVLSKTGGPNFQSSNRYFATKVGILRWLLRHTERT